jgi:glycine/sarcosine N-methyltransferase
VIDVLAAHGVAPGSLVVDAGCGTGRFLRELAARGYRVIGVDRSPELVAAARAAGAAGVEVGDLRSWRPAKPAAAVLCRGVLNDLLAEDERRDALAGLAAMLRPGGLLLADVRDRERSAERYAEGRRVERRASTERGPVVLRSETRMEPERRELVVDERIEVQREEHRFEFRMRPWTADELREGLAAAGFDGVELLDPAAAGAREDRLVVTARRA